jgi:hypothetical protein
MYLQDFSIRRDTKSRPKYPFWNTLASFYRGGALTPPVLSLVLDPAAELHPDDMTVGVDVDGSAKRRGAAA